MERKDQKGRIGSIELIKEMLGIADNKTITAKVRRMVISDYKFVYSDWENAIRDRDKGGSCYLFLIDFDNECIETNCGDSYYDYTISFDNIIKLSDYIKSRRNNVP